MILKIKNFKSITSVYLVVFFVLLVLQFIFWNKNKNIRADLPIVTNAPNEKTMKAFTMGDDEFFYRLKGFKVQTMGDTLGRFSPLMNYDYSKLYDWFIELEKLNYDSNFLPSMVAYYYSQTPIVEDKKYVVKFLIQHSLKNPTKKWWWLYQASYISNYELKDSELAIRLAKILEKVAPNNAPLWVKQTSSVYLSSIGENCEAIRVINDILKSFDVNTEEGLKNYNYMKFFLDREANKISREDFVECLNKH